MDQYDLYALHYDYQNTSVGEKADKQMREYWRLDKTVVERRTSERAMDDIAEWSEIFKLEGEQ